jgi:hypothetical protein
LIREEALTLLKELESTFDSLKNTKYILLEDYEIEGSWELHIEWVPQPNEKRILCKLSKKRNLEISFENGQIRFRRSK